MKKRTMTVLLVAAFALSMTACGSQKATESADAESGDAIEESTDEAGESADADDTLTKIDKANADLDHIFETYGSVLWTYDYVQSDITSTIYATSEAFIESDSDGYAFVDEGGTLYGRNSEAEDDYFKITCLSEEDTTDAQSIYEGIPWFTSELLAYPAEITTQEDGTVIVTLSQELTDEEKTDLAGLYDVSADEIQANEYRLEVNPDTMLIERVVYSLDCGSMGILITDISAEYGAAKPDLPEGFDAFLSAEDVRTITVVSNPENAEESAFTDTIRKGCSYQIFAADYDAYSDAECTQTFEEPTDLTQDETVYLKAKAE